MCFPPFFTAREALISPFLHLLLALEELDAKHDKDEEKIPGMPRHSHQTTASVAKKLSCLFHVEVDFALWVRYLGSPAVQQTIACQGQSVGRSP